MLRFVLFFALVALTASYPASESLPKPITTITETDFEDPSPWFRFPPFGNIFAPLTKLFSSFADIGPRIEIDDDNFRVIVNVKDYKKEDLKVKVKGDFILIQGAHEAKHDDHDLFASQFFHTYTLPVNASAADVKAVITSDGYLEVTAPNNGAGEKNQDIDREVPIIESGKPLKEETNKNEGIDKIENTDKVEAVENVDQPQQVTTEVATTVNIAEEDKKEPTTPSSDREEVTVGVIDDKAPQDNEVNEISDAKINEVQP